MVASRQVSNKKTQHCYQARTTFLVKKLGVLQRPPREAALFAKDSRAGGRDSAPPALYREFTGKPQKVAVASDIYSRG